MPADVESPTRYPLWRVARVRALAEHHLEVEFEDGLRGVLEYGDLLWGEVFAPLRDPERWAEVGLDEEGVVCWPNGADLAPDAMYEELRAQVERRVTLPTQSTGDGSESAPEFRPLSPSRVRCVTDDALAEGEALPTISRFLGIRILMFHDEHPRPHFHARYAEHEASVSIDTLEVLVGSLPRRVLVLVLRMGDAAPARAPRRLGAGAARRAPRGDSGPGQGGLTCGAW